MKTMRKYRDIWEHIKHGEVSLIKETGMVRGVGEKMCDTSTQSNIYYFSETERSMSDGIEEHVGLLMGGMMKSEPREVN